MSIRRRLAAIALVVCAAAVSPGTLAQAPVTVVDLTSDGNTLNVTIPTFDPGIPADPSEFRDLQVFPRIRQIEAKLMPFLLRETLVNMRRWGAVRVATEPDAAAELQLAGTIIQSDGDILELRIQAVDATGNIWIDKVFSAKADENSISEENKTDTPEFEAIYIAIAKELVTSLDSMNQSAISNIKGTSLMRYASELAPTAFDDYLERSDDGKFQLLRLPARNDPMLMRIETIRKTVFVITDSVDAKFREFNADLARTYRVWREYRRKAGDYEAENVSFAEAKADDLKSGSWESIKRQYDAYKYDRITAQEQDRLAVAFNNEVAATVDAMEARIAEMNGWVERESIEWNRLLEELFEVETYLLEHGS